MDGMKQKRRPWAVCCSLPLKLNDSGNTDGEPKPCLSSSRLAGRLTCLYSERLFFFAHTASSVRSHRNGFMTIIFHFCSSACQWFRRFASSLSRVRSCTHKMTTLSRATAQCFVERARCVSEFSHDTGINRPHTHTHTNLALILARISSMTRWPLG